MQAGTRLGPRETGAYILVLVLFDWPGAYELGASTVNLRLKEESRSGLFSDGGPRSRHFWSQTCGPPLLEDLNEAETRETSGIWLVRDS